MENAPELTTQLFSIVGYVAAGMALFVPIFWLIHWRCKTKGIAVHLSLFLALLAFGGARFNSETYVNMIEQDRSEELEALAKKQEERKKKMEEERSEDVANIRFAEDGGEDFLDVGGMDDTDLRIHGLKGPKLEKKNRSATTVDNSLTGAVQSESSEAEEKKLDSEAVEGDVVEAIMMTEENLQLAHKVDGLLLSALRWMIFFSIVYLVVDYLLRLNRYADSYFPLPIPGQAVEAFAPISGLRTLPTKRRRKMNEELAQITRRNQTFLYFGSDPSLTQSLPSSFPRLPLKKWPMEVLPLHHGGQPIHEDFIFEALWYGRSSFYSSNSQEAETVIMRIAELMTQRRESRARACQMVNIFWDLNKPLSKDIQKLFSLLGPDTGISLVIASKTKPKS
jgi:hypothetical protein